MSETSRSELGDWLEGFLFDRRIASVAGILDDRTATRVATQLMTLDATGDAAVTLQVDSSGGSLSAAFTIIDVVESLGVPVNVFCMGRVEGSALAVAAAGSHRTALPHTQFCFSDPDLFFEGRASESETALQAELAFLGRYHDFLARSTGRSVEEIEQWCASRRRLGATGALEAGVIDGLSTGRGKLRPVS